MAATEQDPHKHYHTLYNLFDFLYRDVLDPTSYIVQPDGIVQTQCGCFRLGYSPDKRDFFLFFGWHPEDLRAETDIKGGVLDFVHKDRLRLIKAYRSLPGDLQIDGKQALDTTWMTNEILAFMKSFPRVLFHEASLHRLTNTASASTHLSYSVNMPEDLVCGEASVEIASRRDPNHLFATTPEKVFGNGDLLKHKKRRSLMNLLRRATNGMFGPPPSSTQMTAYHQANGDAPHITDRHTPDNLGRLILKDFGMRLDRIIRGIQPMSMKDAPLLWVCRAKDTVRCGIAKFKSNIKKDFWKATREYALEFTHLIIDGAEVLTISHALHMIFHAGEREDLKILHKRTRPDWHKLLVPHERRKILPILFNPDLHEHMAIPNVDHFEDIGAIDLKNYSISQGSLFGRTAESTPGQNFQLWLLRNFFAPHRCSFRYLDKDGAIVDPREMDRQTIHDTIALVRQDTSDGPTIFFDPKNKVIYTYYHAPIYESSNVLPPEAKDLFRENEVIKFDLHLTPDLNQRLRPGPMQTISFDQFKAEIGTLSKTDKIPSADAYCEPTLEVRDAKRPVCVVVEKKGPARICASPSDCLP